MLLQNHSAIKICRIYVLTNHSTHPFCQLAEGWVTIVYWEVIIMRKLLKSKEDKNECYNNISHRFYSQQRNLKTGKTKENYKNSLTPEQYRITREGGTEAPFTGQYCTLFEPGSYLCICCGTPLFNSEAKYDSGSGWPDFHETIIEGVIKYEDDFSSGTKQTEVKCSQCDAHLGHVFDDGPPPEFKRY